MKKLNNVGAGAVTLVMFVLIIGVIAYVGFYVYKANRQAGQSYSRASKASEVSKEVREGKRVARIIEYDCNKFKGRSYQSELDTDKFVTDLTLYNPSGTAAIVAKYKSGPYANYHNVVLIKDGDTTPLQGDSKFVQNFGIEPLLWVNDNLAVLTTRDITNHGYQEHSQFFTYNVKTGQLMELIDLVGNYTSVALRCGTNDLYISLSRGGGFGFFEPPHEIHRVVAPGGTGENLYSSDSKIIFTIDTLSYDKSANSLNYTEHRYEPRAPKSQEEHNDLKINEIERKINL